MLQRPNGWGDDHLSKFLEDAHNNRVATIFNKPERAQKLQAIDGCFRKIANAWQNPDSVIIASMFLRNHSAFLSACQLATGGSVTDTYPILRACLETAGYASLMHSNSQLERIWLDRHNNETSLKQVQRKFTVAAVKKNLVRIRPQLIGVFEKLYQQTIDFGGHPNERAITASLEIQNLNGNTLVQHRYLHGDGLMLENILKTTAQVGICSLMIFEIALQKRFDLLGVGKEVKLLSADL